MLELLYIVYMAPKDANAKVTTSEQNYGQLHNLIKEIIYLIFFFLIDQVREIKIIFLYRVFCVRDCNKISNQMAVIN